MGSAPVGWSPCYLLLLLKEHPSILPSTPRQVWTRPHQKLVIMVACSMFVSFQHCVQARMPGSCTVAHVCKLCTFEIAPMEAVMHLCLPAKMTFLPCVTSYECTCRQSSKNANHLQLGTVHQPSCQPPTCIHTTLLANSTTHAPSHMSWGLLFMLLPPGQVQPCWCWQHWPMDQSKCKCC